MSLQISSFSLTINTFLALRIALTIGKRHFARLRNHHNPCAGAQSPQPMHRGGGTGPADPVTARPIFSCSFSQVSEIHKKLMYVTCIHVPQTIMSMKILVLQ